jgi:hypothetical protein
VITKNYYAKMFFEETLKEGVEKIERAHIVVMLSTSMSFLPFFSFTSHVTFFLTFEKAMMMSAGVKIREEEK